MKISIKDDRLIIDGEDNLLIDIHGNEIVIEIDKSVTDKHPIELRNFYIDHTNSFDFDRMINFINTRREDKRLGTKYYK